VRASLIPSIENSETLTEKYLPGLIDLAGEYKTSPGD